MNKSVAKLVYRAKIEANSEQAFSDWRGALGMTIEALRE
jgi:hypothetical protein